jgi:ATPase subunit of ABC transporter with duplicated ATPase domains
MTQPIVKLRSVASNIRMRGPRHLEPLRSSQSVLSSIGINQATRLGKVARRDSNRKSLNDTWMSSEGNDVYASYKHDFADFMPRSRALRESFPKGGWNFHRDIESLRHSAISRLSSGQIVRVNLCKALLNDPELLLLDEPTAYLDTEIADRIRQIVIGRLNSGAAVVYTSHNMAEIETMCDRVVLLRAGQVAAIGTPIEFTNSVLGGQRQVASLAEAILRVGWVSR